MQTIVTSEDARRGCGMSWKTHADETSEGVPSMPTPPSRPSLDDVADRRFTRRDQCKFCKETGREFADCDWLLCDEHRREFLSIKRSDWVWRANAWPVKQEEKVEAV